jgi:hypothetical protein
MTRDEEIVEQLIDLCVDIYAHCELDYEINLGGNGSNPYEAANVAREILDILGMNKSDLEIKINEAVKELIEE